MSRPHEAHPMALGTWGMGACHPRDRLAGPRLPTGFGSAVRDLAPFPVIMSGHATFYAMGWSVAWGWAGVGALAVLPIASAFLVLRGTAQIRHAAQSPAQPTPVIEKERKAMMVLNSVTNPIWMLGAIVLIVSGQGRWALPLMVFVIGAHFLPMGRILGRRIDYVLGPVTMVSAIVAAALAFDPQVSWLVVFAVAGTGGAVSTFCYALYLAREYRLVCDRAGVQVPAEGSTVVAG